MVLYIKYVSSFVWGTHVPKIFNNNAFLSKSNVVCWIADSIGACIYDFTDVCECFSSWDIFGQSKISRKKFCEYELSHHF